MPKNNFIKAVEKIHRRIRDQEWKKYIELEELGARIDTPIQKILKKDEKRSN